MLSYTYHSTPSTMEAVSRQLSAGGSGRKSSKIFDEFLDERQQQHKVILLQQRRRTITPRDLAELMTLTAGTSATPLLSTTEESNLTDSSHRHYQTLRPQQSLNRIPFADSFGEQSELEDLVRRNQISSNVSATATAGRLATVTEHKTTATTADGDDGAGGGELRTDLNTTMPDLSEGKDDEESMTESEEITGWQKFARTVLPHVGLVLLTCTYTLIGASIFYSIEQPNEQRGKETSLKLIASLKAEFMNNLWTLAKRSDSTEEEFRALGLENVQNLTELLYRSFVELHMTTSEVHNNHTQEIWTFPAAIFFAVTVVTTVGYGNPVPLTFLGRLMCIFFALIGVPLALLTIADVGKFFSEHLIWLYGSYLEIQLRLKRKIRRWRRKPSFEKLCEKCRDKHVVDANLHNHHNHGHGDQHPNPAASLQIQQMINDFESFDIQEKTVPATLLLFILISYTALGGLLLCHVESWTFFESFYFSFITMTTIGFGDLVPTKDGHIFLKLLYIILGLIITTMCIDLVGVHYVQKIHYFGRKIQDARSALAIVGGKVVYIGDLYAQLLAKRYGIPKDQIGLMSDAFIIENLYSTRHLIPFIPRDIRRIRYIDECSDTLTTSSCSYDTASCRYCHERMATSVSRYSMTSTGHHERRLL